MSGVRKVLIFISLVFYAMIPKIKCEIDSFLKIIYSHEYFPIVVSVFIIGAINSFFIKLMVNNFKKQVIVRYIVCCFVGILILLFSLLFLLFSAMGSSSMTQEYIILLSGFLMAGGLIFYSFLIVLKLIFNVQFSIKEDSPNGSQIVIKIITGVLILLLMLVITDYIFSMIYSYGLTNVNTSCQVKSYIDNNGRMFYFSFAVHFALSLNDSNYQEIQKLIQASLILSIYQVFHILILKISDLLLITYFTTILIELFRKIKVKE
ncbi:hypothetical protein [Brevibacillus sp. SIMBA_040]|uniref:hypothetical protein n=1 Tax=unclassified Brevibacillus TaxID=2684853 RepID=UPI003978A219